MIVNILLVIAIIIIGFILKTYNVLVKLGNKVKERESGIDVLLKQRFDLIPNLVECVKGYVSHEQDTLKEVTELRGKYEKNDNLDVKEAAKLNGKINSILALAESYPELKADGQFNLLQSQLNSIEDKLAIARTSYNNAVTNYNNKVEVVPSDFVAKIFGFEKMDLFKLENDEMRENTKIEL